MNSRKASWLLIFVLTLGSFSTLVIVLPDNVRAGTLYVGGTGPFNYSRIQDAVTDANPYDTVYVYDGIYVENVIIAKPLSLTGEDRNTTVIDGDRKADVVHVFADNVNITGFTVTNSSFAWGRNSGIILDNVQNCHIYNNTILSNNLGIHLNASHRNIIVNNTVSGNSRGLRLVGSQDNTISYNKIESSGIHGVVILSSLRNILTHNEASYNDDNGIWLWNSSNIILINNTIIGSFTGIFLQASRYITLSGNVMVENGIDIQREGLQPVNLEYWTTHSIDTTNTVNGKPVYYWKNATSGTVPLGAGQVILANCTDVVVENQIANDGTVGILLGHSKRNRIANNSVTSNNIVGVMIYLSDENNFSNNDASFVGYYGFSLYNSYGNRILNNTASRTSGSGIRVRGGGYNHIANNTASFNFDYGVTTYFSQDNTISNNTLVYNWIGIRAYQSNNNTINNNTLVDNMNGIYSIYSHFNRIYHNNFFYNFNQAQDLNDTNQWDDGYPSGGNYWNDYNGTDLMSGPNQDIPGSDGIGDTPYIIDADSQDRYPLTNSSLSFAFRPPTLTGAELRGRDYEDVNIEWDLSPDDGAGSHAVLEYRIFRNLTFDSSGLGYTLITSVSNGTSSFTDILAGEGDPNDYFYRVCAVNLIHEMGCTTDQAGKFTRSLSEGVDLVSVPLVQSNESVSTVLQTLEWDKAWTYDASLTSWIWHMKSKSYRGQLKKVDHLMGLWVSVTEKSNLTVAGLVPWSTDIQLMSGWNLVGLPSFSMVYTVADLKAETGATRVEGYDPGSSPYFLREMTGSEVLQAGEGYWVYVLVDAIWTVRN